MDEALGDDILYEVRGGTTIVTLNQDRLKIVGLARPPRLADLTYCRVDAAGVRAEWVEAEVATEGQPTTVYFVTTASDGDALEKSRPSAGSLAFLTGARVLSVACPPMGTSLAASVEQGIAAYAWLLNEGCDSDRTAFTYDLIGGLLVKALLVTIRQRSLPPPRCHAPWCELLGLTGSERTESRTFLPS